jgi:purine-binding chemotaxis protein CheW
MDLVEIRKKTKKTGKKSTLKVEPVLKLENKGGEPLDEELISTSQLPVADLPQFLAPAALELNKAEIDPLDALFSFRVDGTLATEELYLNALMGDDEAKDGEQRQWLTFSLGDEEYALELEVVNEIIKTREVTDIPRVPAFICGIISLRGIIVPVFDLRRRLKIGNVELTPSTRIVVCQKDGKSAGLLVDRINQVANIPLKNIEPPPAVLSGLDRDFVEGVGRVDGRMLILLHLSHVINAELT